MCDYIGKKWDEYERLYFSDYDKEEIKVNKVSEGIVFPSFSVLAGISGTGKSRFVKTQALLSNGLSENSIEQIDNYSLISVRPDWHEPSDLLGYLSRIDNKFHTTDFVEFVLKAWVEVFKYYDDIYLCNNTQIDGEPNTFWLCLDEMNLAPVEQYFADFLSVYESRKWNNGYYCEALIKENINLIQEASSVEASNEFWNRFEEVGGIPIPPNLMILGTVNMDETTHGFSRKVLDRAFSIDFSKFFPNEFDLMFQDSNLQIKQLSYPILSHLMVEGSYLGNKFDQDNLSVLITAKDFLKSLNEKVLNSTPFEVGYRALDQLLLMVEYWYEGDANSLSTDEDKKWLASVFDEFIMTKILPRIEGDMDKLAVDDHEGESNILIVLLNFLTNHEVFQVITDKESTRFDFFREDGDKPIQISCRSIDKVKWMNRRLEKSGYTNFWV